MISSWKNLPYARLLACLALLGPAFAGAVFGAIVKVKPGEDIQAAVDELKAGDELVLADGTYVFGKVRVQKQGSEKAWITIRAAQNAKVLIRNSGRWCFVTSDSRFVRFHGLEITGHKGTKHYDAFKFFGRNSDIEVSHCTIHHIGGAGINCSGVKHMERLTVRDCHIYRTGGHGEGMYLGRQGGTGPVVNSLFEHNRIHDTGGDQGDGIELNEGCAGNVVRNNVIYNTNYPCIYVENVAAGTPNLVEGNVCWNAKEHTVQVNGNCIVRNNIIFKSGKAALRLGPEGKPYPGPNAGIKIFNNLLHNEKTAVSFSKLVKIVFANNIVDGETQNEPLGTLTHNYWSGKVIGEHGLMGAPGYKPGSMEFFPTNKGFHGTGWTQDNQIPQKDFNGRPRIGAPDIGPYGLGTKKNPGWKIKPGFKGDTAEAGGKSGSVPRPE